MTRFLSAFVLVSLLAATAPAAPPGNTGSLPSSFAQIAEIKIEIVPAQAKRGELVTVKVTVIPKPDAWTYPVKPQDSGQKSHNTLHLPNPYDPGFGGLIGVGSVTDPANVKWKTKIETLDAKTIQVQYSPDPVTWELKAVVSPKATPGKTSVSLDAVMTTIQVCVEGVCLYSKELPSAAFEILAADPMPVDPKYQAEVDEALKPPPVRMAPSSAPGFTREKAAKALEEPARKSEKDADEYKKELDAVLAKLDQTGVAGIGGDKNNLWGFVATAALWGLISLVTPCVFPMIPITVSIFMKQAHGSFGERLKLAGVYCLTIITVLGVSAFALLKFMAWLSAHPVTNVLLGVLFLVLALSLFGMYELTLPNFMVRRLQAKQQKGGVVGTIFGALAFTIISFTCVAPFLGGFAGISAADSASGSLIAVPTTRELLGGLAFAAAFAAPFFVLALVPGLLRALPKSGGWLDSVKVVMGFLELAAALKFLRTAELRVFSPPEYFTYDLVLGAWVAISVACGLYLLNIYRLPHDEERPHIGVPRLLFALLFLGLGVYLLPAVFKGPEGKNQRPSGAVYAWVDAFLLPEPGRKSELEWGTDLKDAIDRVRADRAKSGTGQPIFLDFTGVTCTNCSYNESDVFPLPRVKEQLEQFERVRLFTDVVPANLYATDPGNRARVLEAAANRDFKIKAFGTDQLPVYGVLLPDVSGLKVRVIGVYPEGKINDPDKFVAFLKKALEDAKK